MLIIVNKFFVCFVNCRLCVEIKEISLVLIGFCLRGCKVRFIGVNVIFFKLFNV